MINAIKTLFRPKSGVPLPAVPDGTRIYCIGDIHGRRDLFEVLRTAIDDDDRDAATADTTVILLGDLVDRGADSAGVLRLARKWQDTRNVRILAGNHEDMFMEAFDSVEVLRHFLKHGGRETLLSFGLERTAYNRLSLDELYALLPDLVPQDIRDFIGGFEELIVEGDYVFVHAGIDPHGALEDQKRSDLLWIRDRFLTHTEAHSHMVVHGHTITEEVDERANRIGIDTGAFRTGRLTALVLEGTSRRFIRAVDRDGDIVVERD